MKGREQDRDALDDAWSGTEQEIAVDDMDALVAHGGDRAQSLDRFERRRATRVRADDQHLGARFTSRSVE